MAKDKSRGKYKGKANAKKKAQPKAKTMSTVTTPIKAHNLSTSPRSAEGGQPGRYTSTLTTVWTGRAVGQSSGT